jgi:uncharacterized membrane protein
MMLEDTCPSSWKAIEMTANEAPGKPQSGRPRLFGVWILTGALFVLFLLSGLAKLDLGDEHMTDEWKGLGFAVWTMPVFGFLETLGAIGILVPRLAAAAAAGLALLMAVVAAVTVFASIPAALMAAFTCFLCAALALLRRRDLGPL